MANAGSLDRAVIEAAVGSLLTKHTHAGVVALNADGICVAMPSSVPLSGQQVLEARSVLDLVIPADRVVVITAWERARSVGASRAPVRLASAPTDAVALHFFDVAARHGVLLAVFASLEGDDSELFAGVAPVVPPRFARVRKNELAVLLEVDEAIVQILGWSPDELVGRRTLELVHPDDQTLAVDNWMEMLASSGPGRRVRLRHRCRDGTWVWMEITNHNLLDNPEYHCVLAEMVDISDEMAVHEALRAREQLLHRLAEALPLGLLQVDVQGHIVYTNDRLHQIVGTGPAITVGEQLVHVVPGDRRSVEEMFSRVLADGSDGEIEVQMRPPATNELRSCTLTARALTSEAGDVTGAIVCVSDVTESAHLRDELKRQATYDLLTQCLNRGSIMAALETALARTDARCRPAVLFVDLDGFKVLNDTHGHAAGDELLTVVAGRLLAAVRSDDLVGRIGGDEFLVVCPRITSSNEAMKVARRLVDALGTEADLAVGRVPLRASIGVAWSKRPRPDAETVVAQADAAMYESKRAGEGRPVLYSPPLASSRALLRTL